MRRRSSTSLVLFNANKEKSLRLARAAYTLFASALVQRVGLVMRTLALATVICLGAIGDGGCSRIGDAPLVPSPKVVHLTLPEGFYIAQAKPPAAKIGLSAALVADQAFLSERFAPLEAGMVYDIALQPALLHALTSVLRENFRQVMVVPDEKSARAAQVIIRPSVVLDMARSPIFFKERIALRGAVLLTVKDSERMTEIGEFIRIKTVSAEGGYPWELGNYFVKFRIGGENAPIVLKLVEASLADDLANLSNDIAQSNIAVRVAQLHARPVPLPPDLLVPQIPYVPYSMTGIMR